LTTEHPPITDDELAEVDELVSAATPGPWHVRSLDDEWAMNLVTISTVPETGRQERWPQFDSGEMVAATLVQHPRYIDIADQRWDENAQFIAQARDLIPRLTEEIRRLRRINKGVPDPLLLQD
jgi:hypothetical protein